MVSETLVLMIVMGAAACVLLAKIVAREIRHDIWRSEKETVDTWSIIDDEF